MEFLVYSVKILKDSIALNGKRLTTFELIFPRFVLAEFNTHRLFSRNAASSRAIPIKKLKEKIKAHPALPLYWGKNQPGMQAFEEIEAKEAAIKSWLAARDNAVASVEVLEKLGVHKQLSNRLLEPFMFVTVIVSATEYDNWFHLRNHRDAQPEIAWVAAEMQKQYKENTPQLLKQDTDWHMPLIDSCDELVFDIDILKKISVGRCCRVSYLNHFGDRNPIHDIELHDKLIAGVNTGEPPHLSPFEHIATPLETAEQCGNFYGWKQYRKEIVNSPIK